VEVVLPDDKLDYLLDKPFDAVKYFFEEEMKKLNIDDLEEFNHYYAVNAVVFEICSIATRKPFYEMIL
jgi:hypothetical protein